MRQKLQSMLQKVYKVFIVIVVMDRCTEWIFAVECGNSLKSIVYYNSPRAQDTLQYRVDLSLKPSHCYIVKTHDSSSQLIIVISAIVLVIFTIKTPYRLGKAILNCIGAQCYCEGTK